MPDPTTPPTPRPVWALALSLVLAGGVGMLLLFGWLEGPLEHPGWTAALAAAFVLADRHPVSYELRESSVAISLTVVVLAVGLLVLFPTELLLARLGSGIVVLALEPVAPSKRTFKLGLLMVEAVVTVGVFVALVPVPDVADPRTWLAALAALTLPMLLGALLLRLVLKLATGEGSRIGRWEAVTMLSWAALSCTVVIATLMLARVRLEAGLLMVGPVVVLYLGNRAHVRSVQENARMRSMYELATTLSRMPELDGALVKLVTEARQALRGERAELLVHAFGHEGEDLVIAIDEHGDLASRSADPEEAAGRLLLTDGQQRRVSPRNVAVAVASGGDALGTLVVSGHRQDRAGFDEPDAVVLGGIASQVASVIARSRLTAQLQTTSEARDYLEAHDVLTGLDNRRSFLSMLSSAGARDGVSVPGLTVALVNLRSFRAVNETLGPAAGDRVLGAFAERLRAAAPPDAVVARLGGDEFAIAVEGPEWWQGASEVVTTALDGLGVRGRPVALDAAVGVVHWPSDVATTGRVLQCADLAMATARTEVGTRVVRYDEAIEQAARRRRRLASDLRPALERGEVRVVYQPLVDLRTEIVVGVEALARWDHPALGVVSPDEFVAVAEETGQVDVLTDHSLDVACRQAAGWVRAGHDLGVSVNISAQDLAGDALPDRVTSALRRHGLPARRLTLELTETSMMADRDHSTAVIAELALRGVGVAIDDFGTGHSSLAYLASLAVSKVKIDRAFVRDLATSEQSQLIVRAVVGLAASRDLGVVAEGIEDRATFDLLRELGVDIGQGYLIGRPGPVEAVMALLARPSSPGPGTAVARPDTRVGPPAARP